MKLYKVVGIIISIITVSLVLLALCIKNIPDTSTKSTIVSNTASPNSNDKLLMDTPKPLSSKDIKNIMKEIDSRVKKVNDRLNYEYYKDYYDGEILIFRNFHCDVDTESFAVYYLYYNEQGKLIYADIAHYRDALYSIYFHNDELLHVEVGSIHGDMAAVKAVIEKDPSFDFVLKDISLCLENAYKSVTPDAGIEPATEVNEINWNELMIPVTEFFGNLWGGTLVYNSKYYFYIQDNNIIRLNKKTHEQIKIAEVEKKRNYELLLYLNGNQLYYINQYTSNIYSMDFAGKKKKQILSREVLEKYKGAMENPAILGMHIHKGEVYVLLSAYEMVHYNAKQDKLEYIAFDVRDGCFYKDSFYYIQRVPSPIYSIELNNNKENSVKKSKSYRDLFVFDNQLYYDVDGKLYKYYKDKKDSLFLDLSGDKDFIEYVPSKDVFSYTYSEKDDLYLSWKNDTDKNWSSIILPEELYSACGIIDGVLFYEAVDLEDEDEESLPYYKTINVF